MNHLTTGHIGENLAISLLKANGYKILQTNYRASNRGEIDIIATHTGVLVFIEVKTRRSPSPGLAEQAVNKEKLRKLTEAAEFYLSQHNLQDREYRIDVVAIGINAKNEPVYQNILPNVTI